MLVTSDQYTDYRGVLISGGEKMINAIPSIRMIHHTDTIENA